MKLRSEAFPYPVLSTPTASTDYLDSQFQCFIKFETLLDDKTDKLFLKIKYKFMLSNDAIQQLINDEKANYAIQISSVKTGYREIEFMKEEGEYEIDMALLYEKLEFTPLIIATDEKKNFTSDQLNPEFLIDQKGEQRRFQSFHIRPGDMLAFAEPTIKFVEFEATGTESLLSYRKNQELEPYSYQIDPESTYQLIVYMGEEFHKMWENRETRDYLYSQVVKDCILVTLDEYRTNKDDILDKRWARKIMQAVVERNLDLDGATLNDLNYIAQELSEEHGPKLLMRKLSQKEKN